MFLYLLTNSVNGKVYVGKTVSKNLGRYFSVKRWQAKNGNPSRMPVVNAIAKYGWDKFEVKVLAEVSDEKLLNVMERIWINELGATDSDKGYNVQLGGGTGNLGRKFSQEHKDKIGVANKGKKPKGYSRTDKHRQQISARMQGNTNGTKITTELRAKWNDAMTPEQRRERGRLAAAARWKKEAQDFTSG